MIVSEEQVRNVLKMRRELKTENKRATKTPDSKGELSKLSSHTRVIKLVKSSLSEATEVRKKRVAALKEHIAKGKYQPTGTHIASKMVNRSLVDSTMVQVNFK